MDLFTEIVDFFQGGGSSEAPEPPGYGPDLKSIDNHTFCFQSVGNFCTHKVSHMSFEEILHS